MKSLEMVLKEIAKYNSPHQRVVVLVGNDHYYDTTPDGAYVAIGDTSGFMVTSINDDAATERWLPVIINCIQFEEGGKMKVKDILSKLEEGRDVLIFKASSRYTDKDHRVFAWYLRVFYDDENSSLELSAVPNEVMEMPVISIEIDDMVHMFQLIV